jgi:hypothetical protein
VVSNVCKQFFGKQVAYATQGRNLLRQIPHFTFHFWTPIDGDLCSSLIAKRYQTLIHPIAALCLAHNTPPRSSKTQPCVLSGNNNMMSHHTCAVHPLRLMAQWANTSSAVRIRMLLRVSYVSLVATCRSAENIQIGTRLVPSSVITFICIRHGVELCDCLRFDG